MMTAEPATLLAWARDLLDRPDVATAGRWPRAAALLGRQALEFRLAQVLAVRHADLPRCSARAQLLCLPLVCNADIARDVAHVWAALSHACHHHAYDLPPTVGELDAWLSRVDAFLRD